MEAISRFVKKFIGGREVNDPVPMEIPAGMRRPETVQEMMARLVRTTISESAARAGHETFEESFDFDVDEEGRDELPLTSHELVAMRAEYHGEQGQDADADTGSGEDGRDGEGGDRSGSRERGRRRSSEDESREGDRDSRRDDRRGTADRNSRRERRNARVEDDRESRGRSSDREELED